MKRFSLLLVIFLSYFASGQTLQEVESQRVHLPNGWSLTPVGKALPLGDLPLNMAVSASKKYVAVTNNGQSVQSLQLIDAANEVILDNVVVPKSWYGLKFSADEKYLYASGGNDNRILQYAVKNNKLILNDSLILGKKWPVKISPTGLDIDETRKILYTGTKENSSLYIVDLATKKVKKQVDLPAEVYTCLLSPDKKTLYISCWGCNKILLFDTGKEKIIGEIPVGDHPNELCLTKKGNYLYVANGNDNSVSVIRVKTKKVTETLNAALYPNSPAGSTSNGLALSADEKTLYIANADNNCLAVFDVSHPGFSKSRGFIPTGWYPTNVKVINKKIWITNGKGFTSMANPYGPDPARKDEGVIYQKGDTSEPIGVQYIAGLFKGKMSIMKEPSEKQLSIYSQAVYHNSPFNKEREMLSNGEEGNPIPMKVGGISPIKYVFYIIKENRTYDQVLGDMKEGNGDTSLVLFGEKITPNLHKIAGEFVLLDNFYCDGEVSADGHEWSMGAYATDYLEKTWPTSYGGRGGEYDSEGKRKIANNKVYLWDQCRQKNISYRSYGEFVDDKKTGVEVLKDHFSPAFTGWNLSVYDTTRFYQWKNEFDSLIKINAVPRFNSIRFPNDHTEGLRMGKLTPFAHVADNDLACGLFLEYLSKSPIWKQSVVFIIEDDAQNGPDHVDAHRTTAYVAGGFVKRKFVDHSMYSTSSMLRTMELILGLDPMSQYDAAAEPMWRCFSGTPDLTGYQSVPENVNLTDKNIAQNEWQRRSEKFNFAKEDAIPDMQFNAVLWYGIRGDNVPLPAPKRAAFFKVTKNNDKDDD